MSPVVVADASAERTRQLARKVLIAAESTGQPVVYGSPAWHALDHGDPRWFAAIVRAAESWREHVDPINVALDVLDELARDRAELRQVSIDISAARDWRLVAERPTFQELQRRRGVA